MAERNRAAELLTRKFRPQAELKRRKNDLFRLRNEASCDIVGRQTATRDIINCCVRKYFRLVLHLEISYSCILQCNLNVSQAPAWILLSSFSAFFSIIIFEKFRSALQYAVEGVKLVSHVQRETQVKERQEKFKFTALHCLWYNKTFQDSRRIKIYQKLQKKLRKSWKTKNEFEETS